MANKYVRQDAVGSESGDDWVNAYTTLSAASNNTTRGDTIYVADGTYAGATFNKPISGTTRITIKKATTFEHGTETGWNDSYGDGQAIIVSSINPATSYYTFDGTTGDGSQESTQNDYGFLFEFPEGANQDCFYIYTGVGVPHTGLTIQHCAFKGVSGDYTKQAVRNHSQTGSASDITISYCHFDGLSQAYSAAGSHTTNLLFEYNTCKNLYTSMAVHAEWINTAGGSNSSKIQNSTIRFNYFIDSGSTGIIVANNSDIEDTDIYGNIFIRARGGNGTIAGTSNAGFIRCSVYNNTFAEDYGTPSGWFTAGTTGRETGNRAYNNLIWNTAATRMTSVSQISADYNAYFSCSNIPTETNSQVVSTNPFISYESSNLQLVTNTNPGADLGPIFNTDILYNQRTTWSRGAYEYIAPVIQAFSITSPNTSLIGTII